MNDTSQHKYIYKNKYQNQHYLKQILISSTDNIIQDKN